jgi:hypothetical protein
MDRVCGSWQALGPWWIHDHGAARPLQGSGGHRDSSKREREREDVVGVLTNVASWSLSCGDGHTTVLNRGGRWFSDWEMVPGVRRYWSRGGCNG